MSGREDAQWSRWLADVVDPVVRRVLSATSARDAYWRAVEVCSELGGDYVIEAADGGGVYGAWAELTDLFETGKTSDADALDILRAAAERWLDRDSLPTLTFRRPWVEQTVTQPAAVRKRDGGFWQGPESI